MNKLILQTPSDFNFLQTVNSHGWAWLKPNDYDEPGQRLRTAMQLTDGSVWAVSYSQKGDTLTAELDSGNSRLTPTRKAEIESKIRWMLRLDEPYEEFYRLCERESHLAHVVERRYGRVLRSPTLWEDLVRVIATTNTTWTLTKRMIAKLVDNWGAPHPTRPEVRAFPSPQTIAALDPEAIKATGWGYRAPYLVENARAIVAGYDLEALTRSTHTDQAFRKELLRLRGVGDYAAGTLMILLGRYSNVPVDTVARAAVSKVFFNGDPVTDKQVKATMERFQPYAALALYCLYMVE